MGYPFFLRTGLGSAKHYWKNTCFVPDAQSIARHIYEIIEWSEFVSLIGLPYSIWAVRKFIPFVSTFPAFHGLPVNRERRYFIENGRVLCHHPYWPEAAIEGHTAEANWKGKLAEINHEPADEISFLSSLAAKVSMAFEDAWSVDFALAQDGQWYAIDMALMRVSFHWPECPNHPEALQEISP